MMFSIRQLVCAFCICQAHWLCGQNEFHLPTQDIDEALDRAEWVAQAASFQGLGFFHFRQQWPANQPIPVTTLTLPHPEGGFHIFWGHWDNQTFIPEYHLQPTDSGLVAGALSLEPHHTSLLPFARIVDSLLAHDPRFKGEDLDRFVRTRANGKLEVFCLPPYNPSLPPVYGKYVHVVFDQRTGQVISESFLNGSLQEIPPQPTEALVLSSESQGMPSAAAYAFAWMYKTSFADIKLETAVMVSVLTRKKTGEWVWMHARKKTAPPAK